MQARCCARSLAIAATRPRDKAMRKLLSRMDEALPGKALTALAMRGRHTSTASSDVTKGRAVRASRLRSTRPRHGASMAATYLAASTIRDTAARCPHDSARTGTDLWLGNPGPSLQLPKGLRGRVLLGTGTEAKRPRHMPGRGSRVPESIPQANVRPGPADRY